jgi:cytochrome c-type biogenesis protein CcmF
MRTIPRSFYGMLFAHIGVGVFIIGVTMVKGYETEKDVRMLVGDTTEVGGYTFRFMGVREVQGPNYVAMRGTLEVSREGGPATIMSPEKRVYNVQRMPMTEAAIGRTIFRDLYVSMGEPVGQDAWVIQIRSKPLVNWIWVGCIIMALGGLLAATDRRYRLAVRREQAAAAAPKPQTVAAAAAR